MTAIIMMLQIHVIAAMTVMHGNSNEDKHKWQSALVQMVGGATDGQLTGVGHTEVRQVYVLKADTQQKFPVDIDVGDKTVRELKESIQTAKSELPAATMTLIHKGKILTDATQLSRYNIQDGDSVVAMIPKTKLAVSHPSCHAPMTLKKYDTVKITRDSVDDVVKAKLLSGRNSEVFDVERIKDMMKASAQMRLGKFMKDDVPDENGQLMSIVIVKNIEDDTTYAIKTSKSSMTLRSQLLGINAPAIYL